MLNRFDGNVVPFASEATLTNRTVFGAETQSDDIDDNLNADFKKGWEIVGLNDNPTREDFNAMGYTLGNLISYLYQSGVAEYNALQEYKTNSIAIATDGSIYQSLVDDNIGNALTDATKWICIASKNSIVNNIDELKTISNIEAVNVLGYYTKGDGGGGTFYWDSTSTESDNGGTIIQATGITTGRWKRVFSGDVDVKWFGAKGDGVTDDTTVIQEAINNSSGEVSLGDGNIFAVSRIVGRSNLKLSGKSTLDFSGNPSYASTVADPLIKFAGSAGTPVMVTSDVINGDTIINVSSTTGISAGDVIEIATPGYNGGFIDTAVTVHNGEMIMVESVVSSTQLSLSDPILDEEGFSVANNAQIRKISSVENVEISSDVTIIGKGRPASGPGDNGIVIFYGKNVSVHAKFFSVDLAAIRFEGCYQYEASGCVIVHDKKGENNEVNYGIVPSGSSKYGKVFRNHTSNMRHGIVTSHLSNALGLNVYGVVRELDIFDNDIRNTWHAGIATHNDAEFVRIKSNRIVEALFSINIRERNIEVSNNIISFCGQGVYLTGQVKNAQITNNIFRNLTGSPVFTSFSTVRGITDLEISGNISINTGGGIVIQIPVTEHTYSRISIINNTLSNISGLGGAQYAIRKVGAEVIDLVIDNNRINGATGSGGIGVQNGGTRVLITNNKVINVSGTYFATSGTYVTSYGKGNFGGNWSGAANLTNGSTIFTDNTLFM